MKKFVINRTVIWLPDGSRRISDTTLVTDNLEGERQLLKEVYKPDRIDFNYLTIEENDKKERTFSEQGGDSGDPPAGGRELRTA